MNIILGIFSIVITFSLTVLAEKLFKKEGLYVWISIAVIIANIIICKNIDISIFNKSLYKKIYFSFRYKWYFN